MKVRPNVIQNQNQAWIIYLIHNYNHFKSSLANISIFCLGDEIFSINGKAVQGMTHQEAIALFKEVKNGSLMVTIGRRGGGSRGDGQNSKRKPSPQMTIPPTTPAFNEKL